MSKHQKEPLVHVAYLHCQTNDSTTAVCIATAAISCKGTCMAFLISQEWKMSLILFFSLIKACVHYFSFFFFTKWEPLCFSEKCFSFHLKSSFCSWNIDFFCISVVPLFSLSAIVLEDDQRQILKFIASSIV